MVPGDPWCNDGDAEPDVEGVITESEGRRMEAGVAVTAATAADNADDPARTDELVELPDSVALSD